MSDTKDCPNCSAQLPASATFCTSCGTRIGEGAHADPPSDSPPQDATRVDNPGLGDSTQVYSPPPVAPPQQSYAPPSAPWQPADAPSSPPAGPPSGPPAAAPWNPPGNPPAPAWQQPQPAGPPQGWGAPAGGAPQWGAQPAPTSSGTNDGGSPLGGLIALVGGVLTLVGLFTAWVGSNQNDATTTGWDLVSGDKGLKSNDPYLVLALGIGALVIGIVLFTGAARPIVRIAAVVVGVAIIAVAARDWLSIVDLVKDAPSEVKITAEFGFYLTIAGGIVTALAALLPANNRNRNRNT